MWYYRVLRTKLSEWWSLLTSWEYFYVIVFFYYFALFLEFFKIFHTGVYAKINGSDHYVLQVQISAILTILYAAKTPDVFHF